MAFAPFRFELVLPAGFGTWFLFDFGLLRDLWALSPLGGDGRSASSEGERTKWDHNYLNPPVKHQTLWRTCTDLLSEYGSNNSSSKASPFLLASNSSSETTLETVIRQSGFYSSSPREAEHLTTDSWDWLIGQVDKYTWATAKTRTPSDVTGRQHECPRDFVFVFLGSGDVFIRTYIGHIQKTTWGLNQFKRAERRTCRTNRCQLLCPPAEPTPPQDL